jgi:hypothetical protein
MKQEYFLAEDVVDRAKRSAPDDGFSHRVMDSLTQLERTPLWHYMIYLFAFVFACILCYIFGGKLSFDIITDSIARFFSFLGFLLKDIRFYISLLVLLFAVVFNIIRNEYYLTSL